MADIKKLYAVDTDKKSYSVCFTGHRPKGILADKPYAEENRSEYCKIVSDLCLEIIRLIGLGYKNFITGGAQGFDQVAFWAVESVKKTYPYITNEVFIPFKGQEKRWAKTGIFSQKEYNQMLEHADAVYVCYDLDPNDNSYHTKELMGRNQCMVDRADVVIGQYINDSWQTARNGGTAACLKYAKTRNRELIVKPFGCQM